MSSELERIALLRRILEHEGASAAADGGVRVGIGDDAAVLTASPGTLVWTVDAQVEGTHFRLDWMTWEDVGWRSVMAAASDLAAMAAEPLAALAALVLGPEVDDAALASLARGQAAASRAVGLPIVGGNLARGRETSLTTTVLGRVDAPVLRDGARPGDGVWLAGPLGLAAAGLRLLARGAPVSVDPHAFATCLAAFRRPCARIEAGRGLARRASAAIDVSDGLAGDASHVARASGVRVVLEEAALHAHVLGPELAAVAGALGLAPLELALRGGEDYAVLAFAPSDVDLATYGYVRIGRVDAALLDGPGVALETQDEPRALVPLEAMGFDHFAPRPASAD
jgi:thiamine-monophosphate kinase